MILESFDMLIVLVTSGQRKLTRLRSRNLESLYEVQCSRLHTAYASRGIRQSHCVSSPCELPLLEVQYEVALIGKHNLVALRKVHEAVTVVTVTVRKRDVHYCHRGLQGEYMRQTGVRIRLIRPADCRGVQAKAKAAEGLPA